MPFLSSVPKPGLLKTLAGLTLLAALTACSGGSGDSVGFTDSGDQAQDPVVVEVPIAYVRHPLRLDPASAVPLPVAEDRGDPLRFNPGAELFWRSRADASAEEIALTPRIIALALASYNQREGTALGPDDVSVDIRHLNASFNGDTLVFAARLGIAEGDGEFDTDDTTWNLWRYVPATDELDYLIADPLLREGEATHPYHDLSPHFLPGNRIGFSSTRQRLTAEQLLDDGRGDIYAGLEEDRQLPALNLHSIDARQPVADQISQLTFNPSHDTDPAVTADGWIVFTRWDNAPANGNSGRHLYRVAPSGRQTTLLFGYNSHDSGSDGGRVEFLAAKPLPDGRLLTLVRPTESRFYGGSLRLIDSANYVDDLQPLLQTETPAMAAQLPLTTTEIRTDDALSPGGRFAAAAPLYDGSNRVLVSWSQCRLQREDETILPCSLATAAERELLSQAPPLYGIWVYAIDDNTQQPVLLPREGFWYSDLVALENRSNPALVGDRIELLPDRGCASGSATGAANYSCELAAEERGLILIDSVYDVDGVADTDGSLDGNNTTPTISIADRANPALGSNGYGDRPARFLRLVRPVPLPDDDIKSVDNFAFGLNRSQLMREIVGYAPIEPDGSVAIQAPANTALMLSIVDSNLQRISPRHNVWLSLGAGEILHCTGCHSNNSEQVHGRRDNQPASINPGAQLLGSGSLGFANTDTARWFAPREGASMAASWLYISTEFDLQLPGRPLQLEPEYSDEWAVNPAQADPPLDLRYSADIAFAPGEQPNQNNAGGPLSRIVINYPDHIQPIWARERAGIEDSLGNPYLDANGEPIRNCLGCHAATSADGTPRIAAGQLDLTDTPSASNADYYRSYTELLSNRTELWINADDDSIVSRQYLCDVINTNPDGSQFITQELRDATINRTMSTTGARASRPFFECFIDGLNTGVDRCTTSNNVPAGCTPVIANGVVYQFPDPNDNSIPLVFDHSGLLSRGELRLLAEWLDIGAQYLNDPYHPLLAD